MIEKSLSLIPKQSHFHELVLQTENKELIMNSKDAEFMEFLDSLLYVLYIYEEKKQCLEFESFFNKIVPIANKDIWTWTQSSLVLLVVVNEELENGLMAKKYLKKIEESFSLGSDLAVSINKKVRIRRICEGQLLNSTTEDIKKAIYKNDLGLELFYRVNLLRELFYIKVVKIISDTNNSISDTEIGNRIKDNLYNIKRIEKIPGL